MSSNAVRGPTAIHYQTEIANCQHWLDKQIELISPENHRDAGTILDGQVLSGKDRSAKYTAPRRTRDGIMYFAMYHPAAALHQGNLRQTLKEEC